MRPPVSLTPTADSAADVPAQGRDADILAAAQTDATVSAPGHLPVDIVLAVDLDGTLIRTDVLFESFWRAFARDPVLPLRAVTALLRGGRSGLKHRLAALGPVDVAHLPYHAPVLDLIARARAAGRRVALVTAADQSFADGVAAHLGVFDEVHGTRPGRNLKGAAKAAFLCETYGAGRFIYAGDSTADLRVWPQGAGAVTVTPSASLRARVAALGLPVTHLPAASPHLRALAHLPGLWRMPVEAAIFLPWLYLGPAQIGGVAGLIAGFGALHLAGLLSADVLRRADTGGDSAAERAFGLPRATLLAMGLAALGLGVVAFCGVGAAVMAALFGLAFTLPAARRARPSALWNVAVLGARVAAGVLALGTG